MSNYVTLDEVVALASKAVAFPYSQIKRKKIFFESKLESNESIVLCSPQSKFHNSIGAYWCDLTSVQYQLLNQYDNAMIIFRLEGRKLVMVNWCELKPFLTKDSVKENVREGLHWKMHIHDDHIKITGNPNHLCVNASKLN